MQHFQPAVDYLLEEFPKMVIGYTTDYSYQMATVLHPFYGPKFFRDFGGGIINFLIIIIFFLNFISIINNYFTLYCYEFCFVLLCFAYNIWDYFIYYNLFPLYLL